jgi:uncharacterized membrane protein YhaH (DUF805 family)
MATNPYEAPRSRVADLTEAATEFQEIRLWSAQGRIGRLRYLAYSSGSILLAVAAASMLAAALGPDVGAIAALIAYLAVVVFSILIAIQRSHDMDWSGWTVILSMLVPFAGLIWVFKPGTDGANSYGNPPPPNTTGVKILGFVFPIIAVIGILAAIAIPAYQQHVLRSQALQQQQ